MDLSAKRHAKMVERQRKAMEKRHVTPETIKIIEGIRAEEAMIAEERENLRLLGAEVADFKINSAEAYLWS